MSSCDWKVYEQHKNIGGQSGEGLKSYFKEKHMLKMRSRPTEIDAFISERGHMRMIHYKVCREPIVGVIEKVLNIVTLGKVSEIKKRYDYDEVFHLFVVITFEDGEKYKLQKNELVEIKPFKKLKEQTECMDVNVRGKSFNDVIIPLEKKYPNSLYLYQAWNYNCQDFMKKFMQQSGVKGLDSFIMQDFSDLFTKKKMRSFARWITGLPAAVKRYIFGQGEIEYGQIDQ